MAIGLSDALGGFAPLETPRPLPQVAVDALARLDGDALRTVVAAAAARTLAPSHSHARHQLGDEGETRQMASTVGQHEATDAVICLLVLCAREIGPDRGDSVSSLRQAIVDCGIEDEPLTARLLPLLSPHIALLRATLRATSFEFAHIVDVNWRLDYVLRSSAEGNVHTPVYYVQLKVQPPQGAVRDVSFACSVEGLRDLVYRLQDATNTIEKIGKTTTATAMA